MPNASHNTITKRLERVLIGILENPSASLDQKLEAGRQLVAIKKVKPKTRKPRKTRANASRSSVLGTIAT